MEYQNVKTNLTKHQIEKLAHAIKRDTGVTLRLKRSLNGPHSLPLTMNQLNKLEDESEHDITLSVKQIKYIKQHPNLKHGGFLPLITLIPLIASVLGGIGGLTGGIASAVSSAKQNNETVRHNKVVENHLAEGLYLKPSGSGVRAGCVMTNEYKQLQTKILSLAEHIKEMNTKYGAGPIGSFLSNIPFLGSILSPIANTIGLGLHL